ncbi:MAG TPA: hypothetical protein VGR84_18940 [Candidatus Acidoferrales bacterium]|nr:hypothetical protein [Candidatus Acidoferrales bacterium]
MPLPVTFATLPATSPQPLSLFDQQFAALALCTIIPCTVTGANTLTMAPLSGTPTPVYNDLAAFSGIAASTNTGAVTAAVGGLAALPVYLDTSSGPVALSGGEIAADNAIFLMYDATLNSGGGGFHLRTTAVATLPSIGTLDILANITGGSAAPIGNTLTAILDAILGTTVGSIIARGASVWGANTETSWNPAIAFGGASTGVAYTTQLGQYLSIGRLTIGFFDVVLSSKGSASGAATISIPVTAGASRPGSVVISYYNALASGDTGMIFANVSAAAAVATLYQSGGTGTVTALTNSDFTNTSALTGFFFVFTG